MVICHFVSAFLAIPPAQFKLVLDSVIWGFKHTMRNVADTGLSILYQMLQNVAQMDNAAQSFYQTYYTDILQHIFSVVTDSSHSAGWIYYLQIITLELYMNGPAVFIWCWLLKLWRIIQLTWLLCKKGIMWLVLITVFGDFFHEQ